MLEQWSDVRTGVRRRRNSLGYVTYGTLVCRPNGNGGHSLYFLGDNPKGALDRTLASRSKPSRLKPELYHLVDLPIGEYWVDIERTGGGAELYKIFPALPLEVDPIPVQSPLDQLFGRAQLHPPLPRKLIYISRPTA